MKPSAIRKALCLLLIAALLQGMMATAMAAQSRCDILGYHHWGGWKTTKSASCTAQGSEERTCSFCGKKETRAIAAKGHSFKFLRTEQEATCTEDGIALYTCPQCSAKENRTIKAKGHDWDEGEITTTGFLEASIKTYTCKSCGETKTEEVPVESVLSGHSIMDLLRNGMTGTDETSGENDLHIVTQPEGGTIPYGGSMPLSVEAAGGTETYIYTWQRKYYGSSWSFIFPWRKVDGADGSTCDADRGNYLYYCTVFDTAGHHVSSEKVQVNYFLYIKKQPENMNLYGRDSVTLSCRADGGAPFEDGSYLYAWYDSGGNLLQEGSSGEYNTSEEGTYYCEAEDSSGERKTSATCTVYSAIPLYITGVSEDQYLLPGEVSLVYASVSGGVQPLTVTWMLDDEELYTDQIDILYQATAIGFGNREDVYTLVATDAMGETATAEVSVLYRQLKICLQPVGGTLSDEGHFLFVALEEGKSPFTFTLYRDGEVYDTCSQENAEYRLRSHEPGEYYFLVEDADGRWAESDHVQVTAEDAEEDTGLKPVIVTQPMGWVLVGWSGQHDIPLFCEAESVTGDDSGLIYSWHKKGTGTGGSWGSGWGNSPLLLLKGSDEDICGTYRCMVTDLNTGESAYSDEATVSIQD